MTDQPPTDPTNQTVIAHPGDTALIRMPVDTSAQALDQLAHHLRDFYATTGLRTYVIAADNLVIIRNDNPDQGHPVTTDTTTQGDSTAGGDDQAPALPTDAELADTYGPWANPTALRAVAELVAARRDARHRVELDAAHERGQRDGHTAAWQRAAETFGPEMDRLRAELAAAQDNVATLQKIRDQVRVAHQATRDRERRTRELLNEDWHTKLMGYSDALFTAKARADKAVGLAYELYQKLAAAMDTLALEAGESQDVGQVEREYGARLAELRAAAPGTEAGQP